MPTKFNEALVDLLHKHLNLDTTFAGDYLLAKFLVDAMYNYIKEQNELPSQKYENIDSGK